MCLFYVLTSGSDSQPLSGLPGDGQAGRTTATLSISSVPASEVRFVKVPARPRTVGGVADDRGRCRTVFFPVTVPVAASSPSSSPPPKPSVFAVAEPPQRPVSHEA